MEALSKEHFIKLFEEKSQILHPLPADRKIPPRSSGALIYGLSSMQSELDHILNKEVDELGRYSGRLNYAKFMAKQARENWQDYRDAQPHLSKDSKPDGEFLENMNKWDAQILVLEKEARALTKEIERVQREEQEAVRNAKTGVGKRALLAGKLRDGKLVRFADRVVVQNEKDENVFEDNHELVSVFIDREKAKRRGRFHRMDKKKRSRLNL
jgi:hypothetical protein